MDPNEHARKVAASMKERTGKTVEEWVELVRQTLPAEKKGRLKWLKETYGLGMSSAYIILDRVERDGGGEGLPMRTPDLVDAQFTGPERIKVKAVAETQAEIEELWGLVRMAYEAN